MRIIIFLPPVTVQKYICQENLCVSHIYKGVGITEETSVFFSPVSFISVSCACCGSMGVIFGCTDFIPNSSRKTWKTAQPVARRRSSNHFHPPPLVCLSACVLYRMTKSPCAMQSGLKGWIEDVMYKLDFIRGALVYFKTISVLFSNYSAGKQINLILSSSFTSPRSSFL